MASHDSRCHECCAIAPVNAQSDSTERGVINLTAMLMPRTLCVRAVASSEISNCKTSKAESKNRLTKDGEMFVSILVSAEPTHQRHAKSLQQIAKLQFSSDNAFNGGDHTSTLALLSPTTRSISSMSMSSSPPMNTSSSSATSRLRFKPFIFRVCRPDRSCLPT